MANRDIVTRGGKGSALSSTDYDQNVKSHDGTVEEQTGTTYTVIYTDQNKTIELNNASMVCTLTAIATIHGQIDTDNFKVTLVNTNATAATVNRSSTDTFSDGSTSIVLRQNESITIQTDSTGAIWNILNNDSGGKTCLRVSLSGSQSYDSSSDATVFFDTESSDMPDTFSEFNTGTYTFTAAKAGFYYTKVSIYCTSLSIASSFALRVFKNGTTNAIAMEDTNITSNGNRDLSGVIYLAASDTLTVEGPSVGANTMTISGTDAQTFWEIYRLR